MFVNLHDRVEITLAAIIALELLEQRKMETGAVWMVVNLCKVTFGLREEHTKFTKGEYKYGITIKSEAGKKYATILFSNSDTYITQWHIPNPHLGASTI